MTSVVRFEEWQEPTGTTAATVDGSGNVAFSGTITQGGVLMPSASALNAFGTWTAFAPTPVNVTGTFSPAEYCQINDLIFYRGRITLTSIPTGSIFINLPVAKADGDFRWGLHNSNCDYLDVSAGTHYTGFAGFNGQQIQFVNAAISSAVNATVPFTWAVGDYIEWSMVYKAA